MADFELRFDGSGNHLRFDQAVTILGDERKAHSAFRRAVNRVGDMGRTRVYRALAAQTGLTQKRLKQLGGLRISRANFSRLEYRIEASGRELPLKEFGARQFGYGVRAKPWGRSQRFDGAFIFAGHPRSGQPVAGGNVFKRVSRNSLPIEMLYGPSIPKEMVKGATARAFEDASVELGPRIAHEVRRLTDGVVG